MPEDLDQTVFAESRSRRIGAALLRALRSPFGLSMLLVGLTVAVYARAVRFGFVVFDDPRYVTENFYVLSGLSFRGIRWAFTTFHDCNWIPLTWLSLMLDTALFGPSAAGYHATNILFHTANALLVFVAFRWATRQTLPSALVAALFAVHPMHVESVAWIAERKDVLSTFFGLLSLCAYIRFARHRSGGWMLLAFLALACSLMTKQTFVTLPFVFLLIDYWPLGRFGRGDGGADGVASKTRLVLEKIPFLALSGAACAVVLFAQERGHSVRSIAELALPIRVENAVLAYGQYLEKAVCPLGLAIFYPHPQSTIRLTGVAGALLILVAITVVAITRRQRWPFVTVGWFWFLGTLVPMIGLVQVGLQQRADRYAYFPYLGLFLACAWLVREGMAASARWRRGVPALCVAIIVVYAGMSYRQVGYWRDGVTLMIHSLAVTDDNPFARTVLGAALLDQSKVDDALNEYQRAIDLAPRDVASRVALGGAFYALKRFDEAAEQFRTALEIDDHCAQAHTGLALTLCSRQEYDEARTEFLRAIEIDQSECGAYSGLAVLCHTLGEREQALAYAERTLQIDDTPPHCQRLLAIKLFDEGRVDEAIERWRQLAAIAPENAEVRAELEGAIALTQEASAPQRQ